MIYSCIHGNLTMKKLYEKLVIIFRFFITIIFITTVLKVKIVVKLLNRKSKENVWLEKIKYGKLPFYSVFTNTFFKITKNVFVFCKPKCSQIDWKRKYIHLFGKAESLRIKCDMPCNMPSCIMENFLVW